MDMKSFELTIKMTVGEDLTEDEKSYVRNYNAKYSIVRHLVIEKMQKENLGLKNFHFSPGEGFMTTPTIDVVNGIVNVFSSKETLIDFSDESLVSSNKYGNPPVTGRQKTNLGELDEMLDSKHKP